MDLSAIAVDETGKIELNGSMVEEGHRHPECSVRSERQILLGREDPTLQMSLGRPSELLVILRLLKLEA